MALAQSSDNFRSKIVDTKADTIHLDSLSVVPNSVSIVGLTVNKDFFIDNFHAQLIWIQKPKADSVLISYRVFPFDFTKTYQHKDFTKMNKRDSINGIPTFYYSPNLSGNNFFTDKGLDYDGSFSRGISFGNNQDLVVNSQFNLQMNGNLPGGIQVQAAITDNNIPIQPDGNTQQLQDFDRVFIQLKKDKMSLIVGDFDLKKPESYFMNFNKKLQGGSFSTAYSIGKNQLFKTTFSGAISKGKFNKQTFNGTEANQGPYKLLGANGETFIIVLAGSEKVFIDGQLMQRGSDRDYVIDYNSGEITFTPNRLITKDVRIQIEFQYSDKNYLRSLYYFNQQYQNRNLKINFNFFSEEDNKNKPILQQLNDTLKQILVDAGDSLQKAFYYAIDSVAFDDNKILYKKIHDVFFGDYYVYSTNSDSAHFQLGFSFLGNGKGNYVVAQSNANGRVYEWVPPLGGVPHGSYEPIVPLIAPTKQEMISLGISEVLFKNLNIQWEGAMSNTDINTFSSNGNTDNQGFASHVSLSKEILLSNDKRKGSHIDVNGNYEYLNSHFTSIERFRNVEFNRDWNLTEGNDKHDENNANAGFTFVKNNLGSIGYTFSIYNRGLVYTGKNNSVITNLHWKSFRLKGNVSDLNTTSVNEKSQFIRPTLDFSKSIRALKGLRIGVKGRSEFDKIISADTLSSQSFFWKEGGAYFNSADSSKTNFGADYTIRNDFKPKFNSFFEATESRTASTHFDWATNKHFQLDFNLIWRNVFVKDTNLTKQKPDESLLGRLQTNMNAAKSAITWSNSFDVGSEQEQKREYTYVQVPSGQGIYYYAGDFNGNGVQDLNEFEVAPFVDEANYIRVFVPTNEYVKAYSIHLNESVLLNPKNVWNDKKGIRKLLSRFSSQSILQIEKKTLPGNLSSAFNPFDLHVNDSVLITASAVESENLSFNRSNPKFGIDAGWQNNTQKYILTNGAEGRSLEEYNSKMRWNWSKKISWQLKATQKTKSNQSEFFAEHNFKLLFYSASPTFTYQPTNDMRFMLNYSYTTGKNIYTENGETSFTNKASIEWKYNSSLKSNINLKITFAEVKFNGKSNTPVQLAMLDGLQNGSNAIWNIDWQRKLSNNMELTLSYDGRKTGTAKIVNTGRVQVRALF